MKVYLRKINATRFAFNEEAWGKEDLLTIVAPPPAVHSVVGEMLQLPEVNERLKVFHMLNHRPKLFITSPVQHISADEEGTAWRIDTLNSCYYVEVLKDEKKEIE